VRHFRKHGFRAPARVVELVDTLASGASGGNPVEVRVFSRAPYSQRGLGFVRGLLLSGILAD
jgi:hypothetical protein